MKRGQPAALDFGVTCGLRNDILEHSVNNNQYATEQYAQLKRNTLNMKVRCLQNDMLFVPMIMEDSGGTWGTDANDIWKSVIQTTASLTGEPRSSIANSLYQALSFSLHKANARAILKRLPGQRFNDQVVENAANIIMEEGV